MAFTFPMATAEFADIINVASGNFHLSDSRRVSISARGEVVTTVGAFRRWMGSVTLTPLRNAAAGAVDSLMHVLTEPGASILLYDHRRPYPALDPTGSIIGAAPVVIASVNANMKELALDDLTAAYQLSRGDYLSFTYVDDAGQTQWSLHQVVTLLVTADGAGLTSQFEVRPHLPEGVTLVGLSVNLRKPCCKAVLKPGAVDFSMGSPGVISDGQQFEFLQTRR